MLFSLILSLFKRAIQIDTFSQVKSASFHASYLYFCIIRHWHLIEIWGGKDWWLPWVSYLASDELWDGHNSQMRVAILSDYVSF